MKGRDRNRACYCGSGRKFKGCHLRWSIKPQVPEYKFGQKLHAVWRRGGRCLYPTSVGIRCGKRSIKSHTIQQKGPLARIAENGHVWVHRANFEERAFRCVKIGVHQATTFPGFCAEHDNQVFAPVEKDEVEPTREAAFLLGYKANCVQEHEKNGSEKLFEWVRNADSGVHPLQQIDHQQTVRLFLQETRVGQDDVARMTAYYEDALLKNDTKDYCYYALVFDGAASVACCGSVLPQFDMCGQRLQDITNYLKLAELGSVTILPLREGNLCILGWHRSHVSCAKLADSLRHLPDDSKADAFLRFAFAHTNVFFKHPWFQGLSRLARDQVEMLALSGVLTPQEPINLRLGGHLETWKVMQEVIGY